MRRIVPLLLALALTGARAPAAAPAAPPLSTAAGWLRSYLEIDTTNPPGNEFRGADFLQRILRAAGVDSQLVVSAAGRTSLYARLRARPGVDGPALLLLHHIDVVAPGPGWSVPPFGGVVRDGKLWGRGALDVKSLGIAQLAAVTALARSHARLERDVIYLAVADEEAGGIEGTGWLFEHHPELFRGVAGVLNEGGMAKEINGRLLWWGIETAEKRPLWLEVSTQGRGGHAAGFHPHSAPHQLIEALARLLARPAQWRVTAAARNYLQALAPLHNAHWRPIFDDIDRYVRPSGPTTDLLPGMANLFLDTIQVTMLDAGEKINVVPARASARIDVRLLPDTDEAAFLADLERRLGKDVDTTVLLTAPPAPPSPTTGPVWRAMRSVLGAEAPVVPFFSSGFTDSRYFRQHGIAAYGISPFAIEPGDLGGIHGLDEAIPLAAFDRGVDRMTAILRAWVRAR